MTPLIDFNIFAVNYIPPKKRNLPFFKKWLQIILSQMFRLNTIFVEYQSGMNINNLIFYNPANSYDFDEEVIFKYKIYKSLIDSNSGNQPDINLDKWELILPSFIGTRERIYFGNGRLNLEYAINRYFVRELQQFGFVGFRQPDDPVSPTRSDIYIDNTSPFLHSFIVGDTEIDSDRVSANFSTGFVGTNEVFSASSTYLFTINIPSSVFGEIDSDSIIAEKIVRNFFDDYLISGTQYELIIY